MSLPLRERAHACGKVILLGEHSVVYGYPAIAAGLPGGLELVASAHADPTAPMTLQIPRWELDLELHAENEHPVARAALEVLTHCDGPVTGWAIRGNSSLPAAAGLGSSAALCVALARLALPAEARTEDIVNTSLAGERVFHGRPSGIDSQVAARGGVVKFIKGEPPTPLQVPTGLELVIIPTGIPRNTKQQVEGVRAFKHRQPVVAGALLEGLGAAVPAGERALQAGDLDQLGELMNVAHEMLSGLGVTVPRLDELAWVARHAGARGCKLTGAGGGGCLVALCPAAGSDRIIDAIAAEDVRAFAVSIEAP